MVKDEQNWLEMAEKFSNSRSLDKGEGVKHICVVFSRHATPFFFHVWGIARFPGFVLLMANHCQYGKLSGWVRTIVIVDCTVYWYNRINVRWFYYFFILFFFIDLFFYCLFFIVFVSCLWPMVGCPLPSQPATSCCGMTVWPSWQTSGRACGPGFPRLAPLLYDLLKGSASTRFGSVVPLPASCKPTSRLCWPTRSVFGFF